MTHRFSLAAATLAFLIGVFNSSSIGAQGEDSRTSKDRAAVLVGLGDDPSARLWSRPKIRPKTVRDVDCWVTSVINTAARESRNTPAFLQAGSDSSIDVTVINLEAFLDWTDSIVTGSRTRKRTPSDLVLFLDDQPVRGLHPTTVTLANSRRLINLKNENVRVTEHVLNFRFDLAPPNKAWPRGVELPEPERWTGVPKRVSVGFPEEGWVHSQALDAGSEETEVTLSLLPRWHPTKDVPEYASSLDSWVGTVVVNGKEVPIDDKSQPDVYFTYGLGDNVTLALYNPDAYLQWAQSKSRTDANSRTIDNLVLFIDGRRIPGLHPTISGEPREDFAQSKAGTFIVPVRWLQFNLRRTLESNDVWGFLLNRPTLFRNVAVSVGFEDLAPVITNVSDAVRPMKLVVIPTNRWAISGAVLVVVSVLLFLFLAVKSDLIRDTGVASKPDGWKPFSLARTQMAFWFFLVFSTYFFIFVITGDKDTIPAGILGLISVSAATAVGSALVDASARREKDAGPLELHPSEPIRDRRAEIQRLEREREACAAKLETLGATDREVKQKECDRILAALRYLKRPRWLNFVYDLLAENETVSFHRFQICVWTLTLGIIFIKEVWDKLAMPEFSATLVGLMGISSGTYVALKEKPPG